jgi:hypothetical protein
MREVIIAVRCDVCRESIEEQYEGANTVTFTVYGEERALEMCPDCIGGSFLQEARPVQKAKEFTCADCGKAYTSQRGLSKHRSGAHD